MRVSAEIVELEWAPRRAVVVKLTEPEWEKLMQRYSEQGTLLTQPVELELVPPFVVKDR